MCDVLARSAVVVAYFVILEYVDSHLVFQQVAVGSPPSDAIQLVDDQQVVVERRVVRHTDVLRLCEFTGREIFFRAENVVTADALVAIGGVEHRRSVSHDKRIIGVPVAIQISTKFYRFVPFSVAQFERFEKAVSSRSVGCRPNDAVLGFRRKDNGA